MSHDKLNLSIFHGISEVSKVMLCLVKPDIDLAFFFIKVITMFKISRVKGGSLPNSLRYSYNDYELARSSVRKYIRANYQTQPGENPSIALYGFKVRKS